MRFLRHALFAIGSSVALVVCSYAATSSAYCQSTTCKPYDPKTSIAPCKYQFLMADGYPDNMCELTGKKLKWRHCTSYSIDATGLTARQVALAREFADSSIKAWLTTTCAGKSPSMVVQYAGEVSCHSPQYNAHEGNANVISFQRHWESDLDYQLGSTTVTFDPNTGDILDADTEINMDFDNPDPTRRGFSFPHDESGISPEDVDLRTVLTHEFGHFIGFGHTPNDQPSIMHVSDVHQHTLQSEDTRGLCDVYGPDLAQDNHDCSPLGGLLTECAFDPRQGGDCSLSRLPPAAPCSRTAGVLFGVLAAAFARRRARARGADRSRRAARRVSSK